MFLAPPALDLAFLPLVAAGAENLEHGDYGQATRPPRTEVSLMADKTIHHVIMG